MNQPRWFEIAEKFLRITNNPSSRETVCTCCRDLLFVSGCGVGLATGENLAFLCASDESSQMLESVQFTVGQGPSADALHTGEVVLEGHLEHEAAQRWPALAPAFDRAGTKGVFAFPMQIGAARVGVLSLYQDTVGPLSSGQHADALIAADALCHVILAMQTRAPEGTVAVSLSDAGSYQAPVHQAAGMLSEQGQIGVAEALVRLRSRAFSTDRPIAEVAEAVISGRLRLRRPRSRNEPLTGETTISSDSDNAGAKDGLDIAWSEERS